MRDVIKTVVIISKTDRGLTIHLDMEISFYAIIYFLHAAINLF